MRLASDPRKGSLPTTNPPSRRRAETAHPVDDRWRRNNRALRAQRGLSATDRQELLRTAATAVLGLVLIAAAAVGAAAFAPTATGQLVVLDEAGTVLAGQGGSTAGQDHPRPVTVQPPQPVRGQG